MSNSTYNMGASIPIQTLNDSELRIAIKEWAEGNPHMERLLWNCYHNGVITDSCCGHVGFISFDVDSMNLKKFNYILTSAIHYGDFEFQFYPQAPNPYGGIEWYKPYCMIAPKVTNRMDRDLFLDSLASSFSKNFDPEKIGFFMSFLNFMNFIKNRGSEISLVIIVQNSHQFTLEIRYYRNSRNSLFYPTILQDFSVETSDPNFYEDVWNISTDNLFEFAKKTANCFEALKNNWTLPLREDPEEDMPFSSLALLMRRKFGTSPEGIKKMDDWLNANYPW